MQCLAPRGFVSSEHCKKYWHLQHTPPLMARIIRAFTNRMIPKKRHTPYAYGLYGDRMGVCFSVWPYDCDVWGVKCEKATCRGKCSVHLKLCCTFLQHRSEHVADNSKSAVQQCLSIFQSVLS
jgi:hypothetical protein